MSEPWWVISGNQLPEWVNNSGCSFDDDTVDDGKPLGSPPPIEDSKYRERHSNCD